MDLPPAIRTRLVAALLGAFGLGALAGGAAVWLAAHRGITPTSDPAANRPPISHRGGPPPGRPEDMPLRLADKLSDELDLDPATRDRVRQVFRDGFAETEPLRRRMGEEMQAHFARQNDALRALLTPEQQARFDTLCAAWEHQHPHRPPPPPPPSPSAR